MPDSDPKTQIVFVASSGEGVYHYPGCYVMTQSKNLDTEWTKLFEAEAIELGTPRCNAGAKSDTEGGGCSSWQAALDRNRRNRYMSKDKFPECDPRRSGRLSVMHCPYGCVTECERKRRQHQNQGSN